jgi:hypothetical protein
MAETRVDVLVADTLSLEKARSMNNNHINGAARRESPAVGGFGYSRDSSFHSIPFLVSFSSRLISCEHERGFLGNYSVPELHLRFTALCSSGRYLKMLFLLVSLLGIK